MNKINIEFTPEEASALANLLDVAVKAGGIRLANPALVIMQKLEDAAKLANPSVGGASNGS